MATISKIVHTILVPEAETVSVAVDPTMRERACPLLTRTIGVALVVADVVVVAEDQFLLVDLVGRGRLVEEGGLLRLVGGVDLVGACLGIPVNMLRILLGVAVTMGNILQTRIRRLRQRLPHRRVVRAEGKALQRVGPRRVVGPLLLVPLLHNRLPRLANLTLNLHDLSSQASTRNTWLIFFCMFGFFLRAFLRFIHIIPHPLFLLSTLRLYPLSSSLSDSYVRCV